MSVPGMDLAAGRAELAPDHLHVVDVLSWYRRYEGELRSLGQRMREVYHRMQRRGDGVAFGDVEGECLYLLIRDQKPDVIFEISPNAGWSTNYILAALTANRKGTLHSFELLTRYHGRPIEGVIRGNQHRDWDQARLALHIGDARETVPRVEGPIDFLLLDSCHEAWFASWYITTLFPRVSGTVFIQDIAFVDELESASEAHLVWGWFQAQHIRPSLVGAIEAELRRTSELREGYPERLVSRSNAVVFRLPEPLHGELPPLGLSPTTLIEQATRWLGEGQGADVDRLLNRATEMLLGDLGRANRHVLLCRIARCRAALGQHEEARRAYRRAFGAVLDMREGKGLAKGLAEVICWVGRDHEWRLVAQILGVLVFSPTLWGDFLAFVRWQVRMGRSSAAGRAGEAT